MTGPARPPRRRQMPPDTVSVSGVSQASRPPIRQRNDSMIQATACAMSGGLLIFARIRPRCTASNARVLAGVGGSVWPRRRVERFAGCTYWNFGCGPPQAGALGEQRAAAINRHVRPSAQPLGIRRLRNRAGMVPTQPARRTAVAPPQKRPSSCRCDGTVDLGRHDAGTLGIAADAEAGDRHTGR